MVVSGSEIVISPEVESNETDMKLMLTPLSSARVKVGLPHAVMGGPE